MEYQFFGFNPKERCIKDLKDFKLTSVVGGLYELLAYVLVNRLRKVAKKVKCFLCGESDL